MSQVVCRKLVVRGKVQGVGFRAATLREAIRIGDLYGHVCNLASGEVEILVQGEASRATALAAWARQGPAAASVVEVLEEEFPVDAARPRFQIKV